MRDEHVHVKERVAVRFGPGEFEGEAAIGRDLVGNQHGAEPLAAVGGVSRHHG